MNLKIILFFYFLLVAIAANAQVMQSSGRTQITGQDGTYTADVVQLPDLRNGFVVDVGRIPTNPNSGVSQSDDTTFTFGITEHVPVGGVYNDSITNPSSGHAAAARITQYRGLHVNLRDASGNEVTPATAANQSTANTQLTAINANTDGIETLIGTTNAEIGATNETVAATDTSTSGLNGLIKRLNQRMTTLIDFFNARSSTLDALNSTTANLAGSGVFLGTFVDMTNWECITIGVNSDKSSATNGLQIEWSDDGSTVRDLDNYTVQPNNGQKYTFGKGWRYYRVRYTNTGAATTTFSLQTFLNANCPVPSTHRVADSIDGQQDGQLVLAATARINLTASSPTFATVTAASATAVASNSNRRGLRIINDSIFKVYIGIGATAVIGSGMVIYPGGVWNMDEMDFTTAAINLIATGASANVTIQEFVLP